MSKSPKYRMVPPMRTGEPPLIGRAKVDVWIRLSDKDAVALAWFALGEGLAIKRGAKGDTWSELVWAFFSGQPARVTLILGWVGWIGFRLLGFGGVPVTVWGHDAARLCLVGGLCVWLLTHFLARGRFG